MKSMDEIREAVIAGLRSVMDDAAMTIADDQAFTEAGLDSMDRMSLLLEVESALGLEFGETNPDELPTIKAYARFVQDKWPDA